MWREAERRRLVRLCATLSGDAGAAEDLAQETLLEAWRNAHKLTDPAGADRWLNAVARNVCLRWAHRSERAELPVADPPEQPFEHDADELPELLALVPGAARELLEERYVHDRSNVEIAARLGLSPAAVSMRLARAHAALRGAIDSGAWRQTKVWCSRCGDRRLLMRRDDEAISFRCAGCDPRTLTSVASLRNPVIGPLVAGLERPSAVLRRLGEWTRAYYAGGAGSVVACTRCGAGTRVLSHRRTDVHGVYVQCDACGEQLWSSLAGLASGLPEVRALERPRALPERDEGSAIVVAFASRDRHVDVAFDRASYRLLGAA